MRGMIKLTFFPTFSIFSSLFLSFRNLESSLPYSCSKYLIGAKGSNLVNLDANSLILVNNT